MFTYLVLANLPQSEPPVAICTLDAALVVGSAVQQDDLNSKSSKYDFFFKKALFAEWTHALCRVRRLDAGGALGGGGRGPTHFSVSLKIS